MSEHSSSGSTIGYVVEGRSTINPHEHRGMIVDGEWRRIRFSVGTNGIENHQLHWALLDADLYRYETANALMHWWLVPGEPFRGGVEARLVAIRCVWSSECTVEGYGPAVSSREPMTAWEKPQ